MSAMRERLDRAVHSGGRRSLRFAWWWKRRFARRGRTLFVTAMPKSASTFVVNTLAEATGFTRMFLGYDHLNEQDLYLPQLLDGWSMDLVCHQHTRATRPNLALLEGLEIRPIVLTRNLPDALVSLCDHLERETTETPILQVGADFAARSRSERLDLVIDLAAPWYLQFLAGWKRAERSGASAPFWLRYEDVTADPGGSLAPILSTLGIGAEGLEQAAGQARGAGSRLNKGVAGRGTQELSAAQRDRLGRLAAHFPETRALEV